MKRGYEGDNAEKGNKQKQERKSNFHLIRRKCSKRKESMKKTHTA